MSSESTVLELVGLIYDAAEDPTRWPPVFLEHLGQVLGTVGNTFCNYNSRNHAGDIAHAIGFDPVCLQSYDEYFPLGPAEYSH